MKKAIGIYLGTEYSAMAYIAPTGEIKENTLKAKKKYRLKIISQKMIKG